MVDNYLKPRNKGGSYLAAAGLENGGKHVSRVNDNGEASRGAAAR